MKSHGVHLSLTCREEARPDRPTAWSRAQSQMQTSLPNPQLTHRCASGKNKWLLSLGLGAACYSALAYSPSMAESGKIVVRPMMKNKIRKQNGDYSIGAGFVEDDRRWPQWESVTGVKSEDEGKRYSDFQRRSIQRKSRWKSLWAHKGQVSHSGWNIVSEEESERGSSQGDKEKGHVEPLGLMGCVSKQWHDLT